MYHTLSKILKAKFGGDATLVGDEGGFAPPCDERSGVELVMQAIEKAGYAGKCTVGLDVAASEFKVRRAREARRGARRGSAPSSEHPELRPPRPPPASASPPRR